MTEIPKELLERIKEVKAKRAKTVLDHILKNGGITTEELLELGYKHAPRAARDVREQGIPLNTEKIVVDGKQMARYVLGSLEDIEAGKSGGRKIFPKKLKQSLYEQSDGKCFICSTTYEERYLQVDHRLPYEVAGNGNDILGFPIEEYQLLCGSCNRAKSWSCEHCSNFTTKDISVCKTCYWSGSIPYEHIATEKARRTELTWTGDNEVFQYEQISSAAQAEGKPLNTYIKEVLEEKYKA